MNKLLVSAGISATIWGIKRYAASQKQSKQFLKSPFLTVSKNDAIKSTKLSDSNLLSLNTANIIIPSLVTMVMGTTPAGIVATIGASTALMAYDYWCSSVKQEKPSTPPQITEETKPNNSVFKVVTSGKDLPEVAQKILKFLPAEAIMALQCTDKTTSKKLIDSQEVAKSELRNRNKPINMTQDQVVETLKKYDAYNSYKQYIDQNQWGGATQMAYLYKRDHENILDDFNHLCTLVSDETIRPETLLAIKDNPLFTQKVAPIDEYSAWNDKPNPIGYYMLKRSDANDLPQTLKDILKNHPSNIVRYQYIKNVELSDDEQRDILSDDKLTTIDDDDIELSDEAEALLNSKYLNRDLAGQIFKSLLTKYETEQEPNNYEQKNLSDNEAKYKFLLRINHQYKICTF